MQGGCGVSHLIWDCMPAGGGCPVVQLRSASAIKVSAPSWLLHRPSFRLMDRLQDDDNIGLEEILINVLRYVYQVLS